MPASSSDSSVPTGWPTYGGEAGGSRYSPLADITRDNVHMLEPAWVYRHGDVAGERLAPGTKTAFQATPVLAGDTLYFCTPLDRLIALNAETGEERWVYDASPNLEGHAGTLKCRGVALYHDDASGARSCASRVFMGTLDARLVAVDAETGAACADFGRNGSVDLLAGLGDVYPAETYPTSPPVVVNDIVVTGSYVADNVRVSPPGGVVRGFDVHTGALRWAFDPVAPGIPALPADESGAPRFHRGTPNAWSLYSVDTERSLIFLPMGGPSPDFYGGLRDGLGYYGSSVVALDARTGEVRWHFQTVHHDLWDYDLAAQPLLIDVPLSAGLVPAVVQATKTGHIFVLDRLTGKPLYPVEEKPVPQSDVPGEQSAATQPFPTFPQPLYGEGLSAADAWGLTPLDRGWCRKRIAALRNEGMFTPPSLQGSFQYPGVGGGINWGGVAHDAGRNLLVFADNNVGYSIRLVQRDTDGNTGAGIGQYDDAPMQGAPYMLQMEALVSPLGIPCTPPPWGSLRALDLVSGEVKWQVPLGTLRDVAPVPLPLTVGLPNMGGPIVTGGGLVFIGATMDNYLRAFDAETGEELWSARLPAGPQATPMTYRASAGGQQFVVIAAGGHATMNTTPGDSLVAFALPVNSPSD
ncbi:MAG: pyrroloquinoline quinone-dependent dehydrogenase [Gammaproteobacteria bacterium]|jgi:quinoprotein glucose dehydrogenase